MEDRGPELLGTGIAFIALAWITFGMRLYVRGVLLRTWGMDDWLMAAAIVSTSPRPYSIGDVFAAPAKCWLIIVLGLLHSIYRLPNRRDCLRHG
jgi:hypothetical protein